MTETIGSGSSGSATHLPSPPPSPPISRSLPLASPDLDLERQAYDGEYPPPTPAIASATGTVLGPSTVATLTGRPVNLVRSGSRDPLLLRDRLQSEEALNTLRKRGKKGKSMGRFYEEQNDHIVCRRRPGHLPSLC